MTAGRVRVLLTGAGGCVGRAVLHAARGDERVEVVPAYRTPPAESAPGPSLVAALHELPARLDQAGPVQACIHAAAAVHNAEPDPARIFAVNRDQTLALAQALAARPGFRRFVFVSTMAVAEQAGRPDATPYAASKREAEEQLASLAARAGFELSVLRLATVYGPHDRGNIGALYRAVAKGRYLRVAPAGTPKTLVSSRRAAAAALHAAVHGAPGTWLVADQEPYRLADIEDALAEAAGTRKPARLPGPVARAAAAAGSVLAAAGLPAPVTLDRLRTMERPVDFRPEPGGPLAEVLRGADARPLVQAFRDAYVLGAS